MPPPGYWRGRWVRCSLFWPRWLLSSSWGRETTLLFSFSPWLPQWGRLNGWPSQYLQKQPCSARRRRSLPWLPRYFPGLSRPFRPPQIAWLLFCLASLSELPAFALRAHGQKRKMARNSFPPFMPPEPDRDSPDRKVAVSSGDRSSRGFVIVLSRLVKFVSASRISSWLVPARRRRMCRENFRRGCLSAAENKTAPAFRSGEPVTESAFAEN